MPEILERPTFQEGQILSAADLSTLLAYCRKLQVRHERHLHTWGLAGGLDVTEIGGEFWLSPGVAVDSGGAHIVVVEPTLVDPAELADQIPTLEAGRYYAVYIVARQDASRGESIIGHCNSQHATRIREGYEIQFGAAERPVDCHDQPTPPVEEGLDDRPVSRRRVLLGFVRWDGRSFDEFRSEHLGVRPKYAGVQADLVQARSGRLTIRSRPPGSEGAPMLRLDGANEKEAFAFGKDDGCGGMKVLFSIDCEGNVRSKETDAAANGGAPAVAGVFVETGQITDGLRVPLPKGITEDLIRRSGATVSVTLTPRYDLFVKTLPPPNGWPGVEYHHMMGEARVDEKRRVRCFVTWIPFAGILNWPVVDKAAVCDYQILVVVPATATGQTSGGTP